ncbi:ATP-dependent DNA helicase Pif1-like [Oculina patagonica]
MLAQELEQAHNYSEQGNEEEDDDEDNELPIIQEEPEEWMLLCRLNQHYENDIAQTNPSQNQSQFDWTATARMMPSHLVRESANWISKQRNEAREDPTVTINQRQQEPVNVNTLTTHQRLAYNIVENHQQSLTTDTPLEPLHMIVLGSAGTGKSYLINTFSNLLGNNCILTGTTGMAGYNIQGCTAHSAVQLPVRNYNNNDLQGAALQRLQLRLSGKHYLILDEMSMLGQRTLAWLNKRLRQTTGKLHVPLGGISVILLGDFGQLPPVGDRAIYSSPSGSVLGDHGHSIYTLFVTVVILMENVRQAGNNPEAEMFRELLLNIRDGKITQDDWQKRQERTPLNVRMEDFTDAVRLFFDKQSVAKYNFEKLHSLGTPIVRISAVHSGRNARAAKSDDAGGLDSEIFLSRGAAVMLTSNLWQEVGLCNGATGVVQDLLFHPDRPPPCLPITALVQFPQYTGQAFLEDNPQTVPIPPHLFEWESEGQRLSRQQLPLRLRYAMTIHKSQSQTLSQAVIDLGKAERAAGCSFVAASRVRSLQNVVFQPMSFQRLQSIGKSKQLQQRLHEEERLRHLAQITAEQYQHLNV